MAEPSRAVLEAAKRLAGAVGEAVDTGGCWTEETYTVAVKALLPVVDRLLIAQHRASYMAGFNDCRDGRILADAPPPPPEVSDG